MDDPKSCSEQGRPGMRVLIVEDCQDTARMMRVLLRGQGYEVKLAFAGGEAIELAGGFRPDVVLLDLTLPDMSGAEVVEDLRRAGGFEGTTFVAISGHGADRVPAVFDGHFLKPLDTDALSGFLADWRAERESREAQGRSPRLPP